MGNMVQFRGNIVLININFGGIINEYKLVSGSYEKDYG